MHSKSLGVALLHAGHCLLGSFLRFVFSHHFHAVSHVGHHRACMGGHIETNVIRPGGQGKGRRDKRADQNDCNYRLPHSCLLGGELAARQASKRSTPLGDTQHQLSVIELPTWPPHAEVTGHLTAENATSHLVSLRCDIVFCCIASEPDLNRSSSLREVNAVRPQKRPLIQPRTVPCPKQSSLQKESVEARPYRYWGPLDCHCRWRAPRLRSLEDRR